MVGRAVFELCDAESVETAFGDDERPQGCGLCCGVDGAEGARLSVFRKTDGNPGDFARII